MPFKTERVCKQKQDIQVNLNRTREDFEVFPRVYFGRPFILAYKRLNHQQNANENIVDL